MSLSSVILATKEHGGATYDVYSQQLVTLDGWIFPVSPDATRVVALSERDQSSLQQYIDDHNDDWDSSSHYLGTRLSPEDTIHMDIVVSHTDRDDALVLAQEMEKNSSTPIRAIYHGKNGEELPLT